MTEPFILENCFLRKKIYFEVMTVLVGSVVARFNLCKSDGSLLGLVLFQILCFVKNLIKMHELLTKYLRECIF